MVLKTMGKSRCYDMIAALLYSMLEGFFAPLNGMPNAFLKKGRMGTGKILRETWTKDVGKTWSHLANPSSATDSGSLGEFKLMF